uniref:Zinc finger protein 2 homolog n=1 Tax=Erpetoichthys calabaricus TaxID=27687 RepID=A0A8C4S931_ERPCA
MNGRILGGVFKEELAVTVEQAVKAAVETVLGEFASLMDSRFADWHLEKSVKEKEIESLRLRLEIAESEARSLRDEILRERFSEKPGGERSCRTISCSWVAAPTVDTWEPLLPPGKGELQMYGGGGEAALIQDGGQRAAGGEERVDKVQCILSEEDELESIFPHEKANFGQQNRNVHQLGRQTSVEFELAVPGHNSSCGTLMAASLEPSQDSHRLGFNSIKEELFDSRAFRVKEETQETSGESAPAQQVEHDKRPSHCLSEKEEAWFKNEKLELKSISQDIRAVYEEGEEEEVEEQDEPEVIPVPSQNSEPQHTNMEQYRVDSLQWTMERDEQEDLVDHEQEKEAMEPAFCQIASDQISELTESFSWSEATSRQTQYAAGGKPFHCTDCGKAFRKSGTLRRHQLIHTGEKPYRCVECGSSFRDSATLKRHQRTHTGEKPYRCSECGKSFTRSEYLKSHQRIHTGEKPYRCSHCWRSFRGPGILKTHQRIHTGEKPYHCSECGKNFSHLGSIKIHMKVHSNEKYCRTH